MFEGNFVETTKNTIDLQEVELRSMNIILTLIQDDKYYIEDEDILMVLQTACMLQFKKISDLCVEKVMEILSVKNCLKIWLMTEQLDLKPLCLKAKSMALTEFELIKETDSILDLNIQQICSYLGNIFLRTDNELSVFQTAIKWWYQNSDNSMKHLMKLIRCVDFKSLLPHHFKEILIYPGIRSTEVENVLKCLHEMTIKKTTESFSKETIDSATKLHTSKSRNIASYPCILFKLKEFENKEPKYEHGLNTDRLPNLSESHSLDLSIRSQIMFLDYRTNNFKTFLSLKENLEGFNLIGYKEYIFMYGGEYTLGRGDWNKNFWAYDTIRERWQRTTTLPFPRRHFQSCIVGSKIFIVGGTGPYRVQQDNLFWYDFKEDEWRTKMCAFPVVDRQIKCCNFMDKFFLFTETKHCGYFLGPFGSWIPVPVIIDSNLLEIKLGFSIFSYKNKLYIKGKNLIELIMVNDQLQVSSVKEITKKDYNKIETVVCSNFAFTLYNYLGNEPKTDDLEFHKALYHEFSLEKYDLDTGELDFVFENLDCIDMLQVKQIVKEPLQMFAFLHYSLVEGDSLINEFF